jgi:NADPH2:quinone reductase
MSKAIRIHAFGGPDVLTYEDVSVEDPGPGQILIKQTAIGINFIDVYQRTGLYPLPLPFIAGNEAAGVVEAIGPDVADIKIGDRVAYGTSIGAYAERRLVLAAQAVVIPNGIADTTAAAMMLKGMTAQYLLRRTFPVKQGQTVLIHAAAGGVGLIACQWAKHLGATVIGTVGSADKAELVKSFGCDHPILYKTEDFVARVKEITDGQGCDVVYDSVGLTTFLGSLDCLKPLGTMALFGQSSGKVPPFDPSLLAAKGSLFLTRPTLFTYAAKRADLVSMANDLFDVVKSGAVKIEIGKSYALKDASQAHRDLESRGTTGASVLLP